MPKITLLVGLFSLIWLNTFSQCTEWSNPSSEVGYNVFSAVPCNGDTTLNTSFEIWQSDAYEIDNLEAGATYEFNHCEGSGAWIPEYTVFAPSGAIDAFGAGTGCSISWTASESGTYTIAINEADSCGIAGTTNNGFPSFITISGGTDCPLPPVVLEGAESFEADTLPGCWTTYNEDGDVFGWFLNGDSIAFDGARMMQSNSFVSGIGGLTPDNYLVSPPLTVSEGDSLYYVVSALTNFFPNEFYSVEVAINGNEPEDFEEVFSETLSSTEWGGRSVDLSEFAGEIIYIAFRHHNSFDQSALLIDAVALPGEIIENCQDVLSSNDLQRADFNIYPNPTQDRVNISASEIQGEAMIEVLDLAGKRLKAKRVKLSGKGDYRMDLSDLDRGVYLIRLIGKDRTGSRKLVIH